MPKEVRRTGPYKHKAGYTFWIDTYPDGTQKNILRPRLIMEAKLCRPLLSTEIVHHKDENKENDDPDNLEVLPSRGDHMRHHIKPAIRSKLICLQCGVVFERIRHQELRSRKAGKVGPFCGHACAGRWSRAKQLTEGTGPARKVSKV
jgi:hypothetical protein